MEYFTEQASTHKEAVAKVMAKYGEKARIMTQRSVRIGGVMGLFAREGVEVTGYINNEQARRKVTTLEEEKKKFLEMGKVDQTATLAQILNEMKSLKAEFKEQSTQTNLVPRTEHDTIVRIEALLERNEFIPRFVKHMVQRIKTEFTVDELENFSAVQDRVIEWIAETVSIDDALPREKPLSFILVGPTGVGKTTTIAKLAARFGISPATGMPRRKVRIITIDNYRIGAKQQMETYASIMGIPMVAAESNDDLRKYMALYHDVDMIFIDTIGKSPRDYETLGRMRSLLGECGSTAFVNLAISATTKYSDMLEIAQQFEPFGYRSIIFTKLDETNKVGSLISLLWEKRKTVAFLTDGQGVPNNIERANALKLLLNLEGFRINREYLEARFGKAQVE